MADKAPGGIEASVLFGSGANFHAESSSSNVVDTSVQAIGAKGDVECETGGLNTTTEYNNVLTYCNSSPDIATDLSTLLTTFGAVADSKAVTELSIDFTAGEYAKVTISGHNHAENAHSTVANADVSAAVPASAGFGVPNIMANSNADASPVSASLRFSCNHVDREGADGNHWAGTSLTFRCDMTAEYIGVPVLTTTDWIVDNVESTDANGEFDGYRISAHRFFDAN